MRTFKLIVQSIVSLLFIVLGSATTALAQQTPITTWVDHRPESFSEMQDRGIDPMLAADYHHITEAVENSTWWDGLTVGARKAIKEKIRVVGTNYTPDDLVGIMVLGAEQSTGQTLSKFDSRSPCAAGDIILANQDDVDAFGAMGCTEVIGDLVIDDACCSPKITDLSPLAGLTSVSGILKIRASVLTSLEGLDNISTAGYLNVIGCNGLTNLEGLSGLTECNGPIVDPCSCSEFLNRIEDNENLIDFEGLSNLVVAGSGLFIRNNPALESLDGLSGLTTVSGALSVEGNPSLTQIQALSNVDAVDRDLVLRSNPSLANMNGLQNIASVGSWLILDDNDKVKNLEGLTALTSIAGRFLIFNNEAIKNLEGAPNLNSIGEILWVEANASIKNLEGLHSLSSAGGVYVWFNPLIKNVNGLEGLSSVGSGGIDFWVNPSLKDISGISNITSAGRLVFQELPELKNIDAASNISWVGFDCGVLMCPLITDIDGLSSLTYVGFALGVIEMPALENLDGLRNVTTVEGVGTFIIGNPSLTSCCGIYQLLCSNPPDCTSSGTPSAQIFGNPSACSSVEEIIANGPCTEGLNIQIGVDEIQSDIERDVVIYPNPVVDEINIELKNYVTVPDRVSFTDLHGKIIWERPGAMMDNGSIVSFGIPASLANGLYYVVIAGDQDVVTKPVVIQR